MTGNGQQGVYAAVLTPLDADGMPDRVRLAAHCRWLLSRGCDGLTVLGTTGEANSFSVDERLAVLDGLADAGLGDASMIVGTGCCAVSDTVRLTRHALAVGAGAVLMLPPFFYKNVADDGLFAAYARVIDTVGEQRLRVILYQFPQMAGVSLSLPLIERLVSRYPDNVVGLKDSSGDLAPMIAVCRALPGFAVFTGAEDRLLVLLRAGGAGCISALANIASPLTASVVAAHRTGDTATAERDLARLSAIGRAIGPYSQPAALKDIIARHRADPGWRRVRPPLVALSDGESLALREGLARTGLAVTLTGA